MHHMEDKCDLKCILPVFGKIFSSTSETSWNSGPDGKMFIGCFWGVPLFLTGKQQFAAVKSLKIWHKQKDQSSEMESSKLTVEVTLLINIINTFTK